MDIKDMEFRQLTKVRFDGGKVPFRRLPSYVLTAAEVHFDSSRSTVRLFDSREA